MNTITYENKTSSGCTVFLNNKFVGEITKVEGGWQYFPKGQKEGGDIFRSIVLCKKSLEED